jgi:replicative DNA helicase
MIMSRDEAREYVRGQFREYLESRGYDTRKPFKCINPDHPDKHPSMSFDPKRSKAKCFSCQADYDIIDAIKALEPGCSDNKAAFDFAYRRYGVELETTGKGKPNGGGRSAADTTRTAASQAEKAAAQTAKKGTAANSGDGNTGNTDNKHNTDIAHSEKGESDAEREQLEKNEKAARLIEAARHHPERYEYFARRGLSKRVVDNFALGFVSDFEAWRENENGPRTLEYWGAAIIPTGRYSYTARNTDEKAASNNRYRKTNEVKIFNAAALQGEKPVFVAEGEFDALSFAEAGASAVSISSTVNALKFVEFCVRTFEKTKPAYPLIIFLDADDSGRKAQEKILNGLNAAGIPAFADEYLENSRDDMQYKDANTWLTDAPDAFRASVEIAERHAREYRTKEQERRAEEQERRAAEYMKTTSVSARVEDFRKEIADNAHAPRISTGFDRLDLHLDGGLYAGLYVIGSISSLGKTTFALQIADQIAQDGQDVLVFSLEMSAFELAVKSVSRLTVRQCEENGDKDNSSAKTFRGIADGAKQAGYSDTEKDYISRAWDMYAGYSKHLYAYEGVGNIGTAQIKEILDSHIEATGSKPVIVIDYLQIIAPQDFRATDKQNADRNVLELKRISRDYRIPILCVSSFNRENYNTAVSMLAFKESGAIEYCSDVLIGLQLKGIDGAKTANGRSTFDVDAEKAKFPREVELKILKNRHGSTGTRIEYAYYAKFNRFDEKSPYL